MLVFSSVHMHFCMFTGSWSNSREY